MRYEAVVRNLSFGQAQAIYRLLVNLADVEQMHGTEGMTWSGLIPGESRSPEPELRGSQRTVTIQPMIGELKE